MRRICSIILLILATLCAGIGIGKYWEERTAGQEYEKLRQELATKADTADQSAAEPSLKDGSSSESLNEQQTETETSEASEAVSEKEPVVIPIDFEALQELNPDAYAWIRVDGTQIDYPIVQREGDNTYYLNHTIEGKEAVEGTIFTEDYNTVDFEDPNTVIYGHNMKNGSMFQNLHNYSDKEFFDEHRDVTIYLPDEIRHYKIFAAYLYDSRHILQSFDFSNEKVVEYYQSLIFSIRDMESHIDTSMEDEFDKDSKIITLSTCYQGMAEKRYLVQAVLVSVEK